ncbi:MAG: YggU family protein [Pontiellaceae bacterium]|nr:YggU family protein [Pontiellaceae bacterium]
MDWFEKKENSIIINVRVVPRAAKDGVAGLLGTEALKVRIQAPPVEGKANAYLVKYLSKRWKISRSDIEILSGETGRNKRIQISNPSPALLEELETLGSN